MKRSLIVALICLNVALLVSLLFVASTPPANAQVYGGGADYLMMTGQIGSDWDAVYVIDLASNRMLGWRYEKAQKRLRQMRGRELKNDFRQTTGSQQ